MARLPRLALLFFASLSLAAEPAFRVEVDTAKAPAAAAFAVKAKALVEEWYPKINALLFSPEQPLPASEIHLIFEPMPGVAHAIGSDIHISAEWVTEKSPQDYGMVVHELTHVVQAYHHGAKVESWVTEGIADYIRHRCYEQDPDRIIARVEPKTGSYRQSYTVSAAFFFWLERKKCPDFVRRLNIACHQGQYRRELFQELCGKDVDALWEEFRASLPPR